MERFKTALAAIFLIGFAALFLWGATTAIAACLFGSGRCTGTDGAIAGAVLGFALLGLVIWLRRR